MKILKSFFANVGFILSIVGGILLFVYYKTRGVPVNPNSMIEKRKKDYREKYEKIEKEYQEKKKEHKKEEEALQKKEDEIKSNIKDREEKEKKFWR